MSAKLAIGIILPVKEGVFAAKLCLQLFADVSLL
jgi:hypothetical protein